MAVVKPFRALRYDEALAGPLEDLVAPPYDVISDEQRAELRARSPYNVVHLTLPDSEEEAARDLEEWRASGVLVEEPPAVWALEQDYVGPDGVARKRFGLVASLKVEPYATGTVLPHERTHAGPKEERLRLLRATRVQLEPIFLLYDGPAPVERPEREPDLEVEGAKLWRIDDPDARPLLRRQAAPDRRRPPPLRDRGRFQRGGGNSGQRADARSARLDRGPRARDLPHPPPLRRAQAPRERDKRRRRGDRGNARRFPGRPRPGGILDVQFVDTLGQEGISYTADAEEAARRVRDGEAAVAYLLRPTRIEDVFAYARRGEVLPQKTTYFFPKLISGLLFHPL